MAENSISAVASRAGVDQDFVGTMIELGIVTSREGGDFSEGDVRRVRLMQTLDRAGVPLDETTRSPQVAEAEGIEPTRPLAKSHRF